MKALTWRPPMATLMLRGKVETRSRATHYRGPVLICAGKQPYSRNHVEKEFLWNTCRPELFEEFYSKGYPWPTLGMAIAVGQLVDCYPMELCHQKETHVPWQPGLWCHRYEDVRPIQPFPWKGRQGWRNVSQDLINSIIYL
ncbi:MAG TPA: hypothetical protein DCE41_04645 [Cytophagales bacterium]|nr:hypothetical protein [Cytophagales bacterium]HAA23090.1 hypothetical protein [Cytophagales bacterium]HAP64287.1 hypothetical protein [Cytophagales bacterium]